MLSFVCLFVSLAIVLARALACPLMEIGSSSRKRVGIFVGTSRNQLPTGECWWINQSISRRKKVSILDLTDTIGARRIKPNRERTTYRLRRCVCIDLRSFLYFSVLTNRAGSIGRYSIDRQTDRSQVEPTVEMGRTGTPAVPSIKGWSSLNHEIRETCPVVVRRRVFKQRLDH